MAGNQTVGYTLAVYDDFSKTFKKFSKQLSKIDSGVLKTKGKSKELSDVLIGLSAKVSFLTIAGFGALIGASIKINDKFTNLRITLQAVTGNVKDTTLIFNQLKQIAEETPTSLDKLTDAAASVRALGFSTKDTSSEVKKLNTISLVYTLNLDTLVRTTANVYGKNKANIHVLQQLGSKVYPKLRAAIIKVGEAHGYTQNEAQRAFEQSRIGVGAYSEAITLLAKEATPLLQERNKTLGGSFGRLTNILEQYADIAYKGVAATHTLAKGISELDDYLIKNQKIFSSFMKEYGPEFRTFYAHLPTVMLAREAEKVGSVIGKVGALPTKESHLFGAGGVKATEKAARSISAANLMGAKSITHHIKITVDDKSQNAKVTSIKTASGSTNVKFNVGKNMAHVLGVE